MSYSKRLVRGTTITIFFTVISALLGYALKFIFARYIEVGNIGLFYSVLGFVTFFIFLRDLGVTDSLRYFIPRYLVKDATSKIKSAIIYTLQLQLLIGVLFFVASLFLAQFVARYYFKEMDAVLLIITLFVYFIIDGFHETLFGIFHSYQNIFLTKSIEFVFQVFSSGFLIAFILLGVTVRYFGIAYVLASALTVFIFSLVFLKWIFPGFLSTKRAKDKKQRKKMLDFGIPTMTGNLAHEIFGQQSIFFLTFLVGLEAVGFYVMARGLAKLVMYFFMSMNHVFYPMMSEMWSRKDHGKLEFYYNEIISYSYVVGLPAAATFILFADEVLRILYTETYVQASFILQLFTVYFLISLLLSILKRVFLSIGSPKIARNLTFTTLVTNLAGNIVLIPIFGLRGAVIADVISVVVTLIVAQYQKSERLQLRTYWKKHFKVVICTLFYAATAFVLKRVVEFAPLIEVATVGILSGTIYLILLFVLKVITIDKILGVLKQSQVMDVIKFVKT